MRQDILFAEPTRLMCFALLWRCHWQGMLKIGAHRAKRRMQAYHQTHTRSGHSPWPPSRSPRGFARWKKYVGALAAQSSHLFTSTSMSPFGICQFVNHPIDRPVVMRDAAAPAATVALPAFAKTCPAIHVLSDAWALDPSRLQLYDHCGRPGQCQRENREENQRKHDRPEFARQLVNQSTKPFRTPGTLFKAAVDHRHIKR